MELTALDWIIIASYFLIALAIGVIFAKRAGSGLEEFFVSGRNLPWWLVGTSMVATTFATDTPNLVTNLVRSDGVKGNWAWWAFLLTGMVTVFLYAKLWRRSGVMTDIGFYELRYSGKAATFLRGFRAVYLGFFFNCVIMANVTLAAIKLSGILLGLDPYTTVLICGIITAIYASTAGLWGVVVTDLFLFVVSMTGAIGAAYYAVNHPEVGGLGNLLSHPEVLPALNIFPDFRNLAEVVPLLVVPFAVQWWSVWYPGAEPGGGGYVAQRMLAAKDERNSMLATLWFNIAHYAIRPWPWILVALASIVVFPTLDSIQQRFPDIPANIVQDDLAYPAMLTFVPSGMLGIIMASLAAAYMSTISTHLNWGSSYLVDDVYRRFVKKDASEAHYVAVARITTVVLMVVACWLSFQLESALQGFEILLQIGAGTGLIYLLRWFWWRVNAWSEISGMAISFIVALFFKLVYPNTGLPEMASWVQLVLGVGITTLTWIVVTLLTPPAEPEVLQNFYNKIRPVGRGWAKVVDTTQVESTDSLGAGVACVFFGCLAVYSALFATGYFIYGLTIPAVILSVICIGAAIAILKLLPRVQLL